MSRGMGRVQRAVLDRVRAEGEHGTVAMLDLARAVSGTDAPTEAQRVSVRRAVRELVRSGLLETGTADAWTAAFNGDARYYTRESVNGRLHKVPVTERYVALPGYAEWNRASVERRFPG